MESAQRKVTDLEKRLADSESAIQELRQTPDIDKLNETLNSQVIKLRTLRWVASLWPVTAAYYCLAWPELLCFQEPTADIREEPAEPGCGVGEADEWAIAQAEATAASHNTAWQLHGSTGQHPLSDKHGTHSPYQTAAPLFIYGSDYPSSLFRIPYLSRVPMYKSSWTCEIQWERSL